MLFALSHVEAALLLSVKGVGRTKFRLKMMNRSTLFLLLVLLCQYGWCQRHTVSGVVVSDATGGSVSGASVMALPNGRVTVVTNADGFFTLKCNDDIESLTVTHVGYQTQQVKVDGYTSGKAPLQIRLKPATIQLHEVLVTNDNARALVEAAIANIPKNYSRQPELYHCFYRETAMKRQHHILVAEGVVDMYKTGYGRLSTVANGRDRVAIMKGRRLLSPKQGDTLSMKVMGGPVQSVMLDIVKNTDLLLNEEELNFYNLKMEIPTSLGDRMQYVVSLTPRQRMPYALYFGRLYIDQQTLAFTRAELSLDMSDREKATEVMLVKKPIGVRFRPKELSLLVDYRQGDDGMARISYLRTTFRFNCDWRRRLFATSFTAFCEMAVTSTDGGDVQPIRGRASFDQRDAFFDKVDLFRDPAFWQDYNIIEPTESLDRAVHRLLRKH